MRDAFIIGVTALLVAAPVSHPGASEDPLAHEFPFPAHRQRVQELRDLARGVSEGIDGARDHLRQLLARERAVRASLEVRSAELDRLERALAETAHAASVRREVLATVLLQAARRHRGSEEGRPRGLSGVTAIGLAEVKPGEKSARADLRRALDRAVDIAAAHVTELDWLDARAAIVEQGLTRLRGELLEVGLLLEEAERRAAVRRGTLPPAGPAAHAEGSAATPMAGPSDSAIVTGDGLTKGPGRSPTIRLPVEGEVLQRFGDRRSGQRSRGVLLLSGRPQPVLAPGGGTVAYAGHFRGLGLLLIIEHGGDYHSLVIGASRLEVRVGDRVRDSQVVGWLEGGAPEGAELYLELRRAGEPVDPMVVLSARESEVRG